jgi:hypothetical protein
MRTEEGLEPFSQAIDEHFGSLVGAVVGKALFFFQVLVYNARRTGSGIASVVIL